MARPPQERAIIWIDNTRVADSLGKDVEWYQVFIRNQLALLPLLHPRGKTLD